MKNKKSSKDKNLSIFQVFAIVILFIIVVFFPLRTIFLSVSNQILFDKCLESGKEGLILNCQRTVIKNSVKQGNTRVAINLFKKTINENLIDCHTLGHEIGRDIYDSYKNGKFARIGDPLTECGYGFWHGFMSGLTNDIQNGEKLNLDLSQVCVRMSGNNKNVYGECYHGFGIGFIGDPPKIDLWGKSDLAILDATKRCYSLVQNSDYKNQCYSGTFHQLIKYMKDEEYNFSIPKGKAFGNFCHSFGVDYERACLGQLGPALPAAVGTNNILVLVNLINTDFKWLSPELRSEFIESVGGGAAYSSTDEELNRNLNLCLNMDESTRRDCLIGMYFGLTSRSPEADIEALRYMTQFLNDNELVKERRDEISNLLVWLINEKRIQADVKKYCKDRESEKMCVNLLPKI